MNSLFFDYNISELINKINVKEIAPADLLEASLKNIKEFDPLYFAWVTYGGDDLLKRVKSRSQGKPNGDFLLLNNMPLGVKDIYNTADYPTQMGSPLWKNFTPGNDARSVFNLKSRGAVVVGKTVTAEFAVHALNATLNPWDVKRTPGTSSSGSVVAVALGMVPVATGTQTAGSIVRPASFCGVYGCKPSFGLIPRTGMLKTTDSLDTLGFFVIHQKDLRRIFDSMRVHGKDYPISYLALNDQARQTIRKDKQWRVGFVRTHTWKYAPAYAQKDIEQFISKLAQQENITVSEFLLPKSMEYAHSIHETIYNKSLSYYFKDEHAQSDFVSPIMNELIEKGNCIDPKEYFKALKAQAGLIYEMDSFFDGFDVLISLSTAGEAPLREVTELPDPALMWTLTHLPVVSVPVFTSPSGLPFGMQVLARKYNDYLLFNFLDHLNTCGLIPSRAGFKINPRGSLN